MLCPLCNSKSKYSFSTQYVKVRKCLNSTCGHLFAESPSPNQGVWTYKELDMEFSVFREKNAVWFDRNYKIIDYILGQRSIDPGAKVLDLGSGTGHIAKSFIERGFDAICVEPSHEARKVLNKYGLVNYPYLSDVPDEERFEIIMLSEVIEHLPSPVEVLKEAQGRLNKQGMIFISTPCSRGLKSILKRESSAAYSDPTHIHFFTSNSLETCFKLAGFSTYQRHYLDFMVPGRSLWLKKIDRFLYSLDLNPHLIYMAFNS